MLAAGKVRRFSLEENSTKFTLGRMTGMVREAMTDTNVITMARKLAALSIAGRKKGRDLATLKGIHAWCHENFEFVKDPVNIEFLQTPGRMLRELQIPKQIHDAVWKPLGKVFRKAAPAPKMTGDSDESSVLVLALCGAVGISPLRFMLGATDGAIHYAWGSAQVDGQWWDLDILMPRFNDRHKFDAVESLGVLPWA